MKAAKLFSIFLILIFVAGCSAGDGTSSGSSPFSSLGKFGSSSQKKTVDVNVYVGTQGLSAEFVKSAPPPKVFENSDFPVLLKIRNSGAYSISQEGDSKGLMGLLKLGTEKDYVYSAELEPNENTRKGDFENEAYFFVWGKRQINPTGDEILVSFNAKTGKLDPQSENKQSTLTATLCYPYKTILSATICIDPDVAGIRPGKKACTVKDLAFNNGQGAPVAVTRIESQMIPEGDIIKPQFLVFIENKGRGASIDFIGYIGACRSTDYDKKNTWNVAYVNVYTSGPQGQNQLECSPGEASIDKKTGFVRLRDRKTWVRCTFPKGIREIKKTDDAFTSPLRIEIDYGYVQTISTSFFIQKPLKY